MNIKEYLILYACNKCEYIRSSAGYGGTYNMTDMQKLLFNLDRCPHCHVGAVSTSRITIKTDKKDDTYQKWHFRMKCGKCKVMWETSIADKASKMRGHVFKPELSCPVCENMASNTTMSIRRTW